MSLEQAAHASAPRAGILLVNLGTPDAPDAASIRRYLREFLSDRRVVELPRAVWMPVLHGFILPFRPRRLVHAYAKVWTPQGSPLMVHSQAQATGLEPRLGVPVRLAMTYGSPSVEDGLAALDAAGVQRVLVLPMYPQYSGTTTAAAFDAVARVLARRRWLPELRFVNTYHDDAGYIGALAQSVNDHAAAHGRADHLLVSFHSIPQRCLELGDPYHCYCHKTARLLAERLGLADGAWSIAFQSRLGNAPWLQPYTDVVIPELAKRGVRTLDVICPGFPADCLETLEEVAIRYAEDFRTAGGGALRYIPALNARPGHLDALESIARRHLGGWEAPAPNDEAVRLARVERARPGSGMPSKP
ncbi:MAG TPA: ferrochelatase [Nevskiaceae bacterium]|nr:ferrochelatase [Nevskiaceae bacterium]